MMSVVLSYNNPFVALYHLIANEHEAVYSRDKVFGFNHGIIHSFLCLVKQGQHCFADDIHHVDLIHILTDCMEAQVEPVYSRVGINRDVCRGAAINNYRMAG